MPPLIGFHFETFQLLESFYYFSPSFPAIYFQAFADIHIVYTASPI